MKAIFLICSLMAAALTAAAQNPKQQLNDQLWEAVRRGDAAAVTVLLDQGADVNARFRYGTTALFKAAERGHVEVVKILLARGADPTVRDTFYGATAMTWALNRKHVEVVRALLEKDSNSVDDVLITGTREGNAALVEIAIARGGAKPQTLSVALATAMDDKEKAPIAEMLKKSGAKPPFEVDDATLQSYIGRYKSEQGGEISLTLKDGKLFATPANQDPLAMMAIDKTMFRPIAVDGIVITFEVVGERITGFTLKRGPNTTIYKRVEETKQP